MAIQTIFTAKMRNYIEKFNLLWNMHAGYVTLVDGANVSIDLAAGSRLSCVTLGGNRTLNWMGTDSTGVARALGHANLAAYNKRLFLLEVTQDATGNRVPVLGTGWHFGSSLSSLTFTTGANKRDLVGAVYDHDYARMNIASFTPGF